jgi:DNA-binding NarL/FixJ family response regulator
MTSVNHDSLVLIVEEETTDRERLVAALEASGYRTQVATTAREALQIAVDAEPALVISEVVLPERSGYELSRSLREKFGETLPILLVSGVRTDPLDAVVAFLIGADDYITKPFELEELLARVHRAVTRAAASAPESGRRGEQGLTAREHDVLRLLSAGLPQKKIAERLVISPKTVATHIQRILGKLGVHSRAEAVAVAYRTGLRNDTAPASDVSVARVEAAARTPARTSQDDA